tara:strand:+ start:2867 stop:4258 length:1392 start_codon:yes stop_codon:yes gene_type:complete
VILFFLITLFFVAEEKKHDELSYQDAIKTSLNQSPNYLQNLLSYENSLNNWKISRTEFSIRPDMSFSLLDSEGSDRNESLNTSFNLDTVYLGDFSISYNLNHCNVWSVGTCLDSQNYQESSNLTWTIPLGKGSSVLMKKKSIIRSDWSLEEAQINLFKNKQNTISSAVQLWLGLRNSLKQLEIRQQNLENSEEFLRQQNVKFDLELIAKSALTQSAYQRDQSKLSLLNAEESVESSWEDLNTYLGHAADLRGTLDVNLPIAPREVPDLKTALENYSAFSTMKIAKISLDRNELSLKEAGDAMRWNIALTNRAFGSSEGSSFGNISDQGNTHTTTISIDVPLDRRDERTTYENSKNNYASAEIEYSEDIKEFKLDLTSNHRLIEKRIRELELQESAFQLATETYNTTLRGYQGGLNSLQDYLTAESSYVNAQLGVTNAEESLRNAWIQWWKLTDEDLEKIFLEE